MKQECRSVLCIQHAIKIIGHVPHTTCFRHEVFKGVHSQSFPHHPSSFHGIRLYLSFEWNIILCTAVLFQILLHMVDTSIAHRIYTFLENPSSKNVNCLHLSYKLLIIYCSTVHAYMYTNKYIHTHIPVRHHTYTHLYM